MKGQGKITLGRGSTMWDNWRQERELIKSSNGWNMDSEWT